MIANVASESELPEAGQIKVLQKEASSWRDQKPCTPWAEGGHRYNKNPFALSPSGEISVKWGRFLPTLGDSGLELFKANAAVRAANLLNRESAAVIASGPTIANSQVRVEAWRDRVVVGGALLVFCLLFSLAGGRQVQAQAGSAGAGGSTSAQVPEAIRIELLKLVPNPLPAQGHALHAPAFYGSNLWEYIDGAADQYLLYGMDGMLHEELRAGEADITADIFSMAKTENAFGIYATERSAGAQFVSIGTEGYRSQSSDGSSATLNFFLERYYVKLTAFGAGGGSVLEELARGIAGRIGESSGWPALLAQLPPAHRLPHSELYVLSNPLGHEFLSPAYSVKYQWDKSESTLVVSVAVDEADARRRLGLLEAHLRQDGKCASAPDLGEGAIRGSTSYEGEILARATGRYLVLMVNPSGGGEAIFREALRSLSASAAGPIGIPSGAKAHFDFRLLTARLKSCPDTKGG
jgi:hypothetical protein